MIFSILCLNTFALNNTFSPTNATLLLNGSVMISDYANFDVKNDITVQLSDNNISTSYYTIVGTLYSPLQTVIEGWSLDDASSGTGKLLGFTRQHDLTIIGNVQDVLFPQINGFRGVFFNGSNYATTPDSDRLDIFTNNITIGIKFNTSLTGGGITYLLSKRTGSSLGYEITETNTNKITCIFDKGTVITLTSTTSINDNLIHIAICRKTTQPSNVNYTLWLDGKMEDTQSTGLITDTYANSNAFVLGARADGSAPWTGTILEAGLVNESKNDLVIKSITNTSLANLSKGSAIRVFFNHTLDVGQNYSLKIMSTTSTISRLRILANSNMTSINSSKFIDPFITTGLTYVPLNNLIGVGYNYPLRIFSLTGNADSSISEISLYEEYPDVIPPTISGTRFNASSIICNGSLEILSNISDDQAVSSASVLVTINNSIFNVYTLNFKSGTIYNHIIDNPTLQSWINILNYNYDGKEINISILNINATDAAGNKNSTTYQYNNTATTTIYSCYHCIENWVCGEYSLNKCYAGQGMYERSCNDLNICNTTINKPVTSYNSTCGNNCSVFVDMKKYSYSSIDNNPHYIHIYVFNGSRAIDSALLKANFTATFLNSSILFNYNAAQQRYEAYFNFNSPGTYPFNVKEVSNNSLSTCIQPITFSGVYHVYNSSFQSCVKIYSNADATNQWREAGYILMQSTDHPQAQYTTIDYLTGYAWFGHKSINDQLSFLDKIAWNYQEPAQKLIDNGQWFLAPYKNGEACVDLFYPGYYKVRYIIGDLRTHGSYDNVYYSWKDIDVQLSDGIMITNLTANIQYYMSNADINAAANLSFWIIEIIILLMAFVIAYGMYYISHNGGLAFGWFFSILIMFTIIHLLILIWTAGWTGIFRWIRYMI